MQPRGSAPKSLFRRVERTLDTIEHGETSLGTIVNVAEYMTANFRDDLGLTGGRIYRLDDAAYELVATFGSVERSVIGNRVPKHYLAVEAVLDSGLVVMDRNAPGLDQEIESQLGTRERFAAVNVADGDYLISFDVVPGHGDVQDLRSSLNIIRLAINQKLRQERFQEILEDARRIQTSILPKRVPEYADFDMVAMVNDYAARRDRGRRFLRLHPGDSRHLRPRRRGRLRPRPARGPPGP